MGAGEGGKGSRGQVTERRSRAEKRGGWERRGVQGPGCGPLQSLGLDRDAQRTGGVLFSGAF